MQQINIFQKNNYYIPSSEELYLLPSQLITAINQTSGLQQAQKEQALKSILYSLKTEIERELSENDLNKCIVDTSPFFAGATQLAWYAADALVIPVRTDQQSIKSLELLINTLSSPQSEFRKYLPENDMNVPKIQMVVLTHCGWSTVAGARNEPNQQTKVYLKKFMIFCRSIELYYQQMLQRIICLCLMISLALVEYLPLSQNQWNYYRREKQK